MKITNICKYMDPAELIKDYLPEIAEDLDEETMDALSHLTDYEPVVFYVFNDQTVAVVDDISGEVIGNEITLEEYAAASIESARDLL